MLGLPVHAQRPASDRGPSLAAADDRLRGQRLTLPSTEKSWSRPAGSRCCSAASSTTPATGRPRRPPARLRCRSAPRPITQEIQAWAHEIRAWMALTTGDYHGVVAAAQAGIEVAPHHSVAVQLAAQEAKAWARIG